MVWLADSSDASRIDRERIFKGHLLSAAALASGVFLPNNRIPGEGRVIPKKFFPMLVVM